MRPRSKVTVPIAFGVHFGALCEPLLIQLKSFNLNADRVLLFQRMADNITFLGLHSLITDTAKDSARRKLIKKISAEIKESNHGK